MAHPNETLLRKGYDAFAKGDLETIRGMFDPNIVWNIGGRGPLAGTYKGIDEVFGFFAEIVKLSEGTFKIDVHDVLASDSHAVGLTTTTGKRGKKTLNTRSAGIFEIKNGKVVEAWFGDTDQYAVDEFWS